MFHDAMREVGWRVGRDFVPIESGLQFGEQMDTAAKRVVSANPDLIYTVNTAYVLAARRLTTTIPIVMWASGFPVEAGIADSLARPGKNVTGNSLYAGTEVFGKLLELLRDANPGVRRIGVLWSYLPPLHPPEEIEPCYREIRRAAQGDRMTVPKRRVLTNGAARSVTGRSVGNLHDLGTPGEQLARIGERRREYQHQALVARVPAGDPQDLRWHSKSLDELDEIAVLRDDRGPGVPGCFENFTIGRVAQAEVAHHLSFNAEGFGEIASECRRELRVKPEFHATRRACPARRAAKSRLAWMSSVSRSGKSFRISAAGTLCASISRISITRMRIPRMHGFPPHFPGSEVIRERSIDS